MGASKQGVSLRASAPAATTRAAYGRGRAALLRASRADVPRGRLRGAAAAARLGGALRREEYVRLPPKLLALRHAWRKPCGFVALCRGMGCTQSRGTVAPRPKPGGRAPGAAETHSRTRRPAKKRPKRDACRPDLGLWRRQVERMRYGGRQAMPVAR